MRTKKQILEDIDAESAKLSLSKIKINNLNLELENNILNEGHELAMEWYAGGNTEFPSQSYKLDSLSGRLSSPLN